jgi:hypothetical protein
MRDDVLGKPFGTLHVEDINPDILKTVACLLRKRALEDIL